MDQTLRQLGELLLGSIPTIIFFLILWIAYAVIVHGPLTRVLAERRSRTEGAIEKSKVDIAAAERKAGEYQSRLRQARADLFQKQEKRRQRALSARADAVSAARSRAQEQVKDARAAIDRDKSSAQQGLHAEAQSLAKEIIGAVLEPAGAGGSR